MNIVDISNQIANQQMEAPKELTLQEKLNEVNQAILQQRMGFTNEYLGFCGSAALNVLSARPEITVKEALDFAVAFTEGFRETRSNYESKLMEVAPVHPNLVKAKMELEAELKADFANRPERETSGELN
jgi:hypothetical protein